MWAKLVQKDNDLKEKVVAALVVSVKMKFRSSLLSQLYTAEKKVKIYSSLQ